MNESSESTLPSFDNFKAVRVLGSGSYGDAFAVTDSSGIEYALKWLRSESDTEGQLRFQNEKWALGCLAHAGIPKLIAEGVHLGRPYFVMSLARGTSLRKLLMRHRSEGGTSSQMHVLSIVIGILEILAHIHKIGILHRDVKDDNIIATDSVSHISLIDFGFCKGPGQPADVSSFWNVGAARYSPPDKLRHPSKTHPTHDVFAIGVVGYLLLTNRYPWDVSSNEDVGHLEELMRTRSPVPIFEWNSVVSKEVSQFIARLLVINDESRLDAETALELCKDLRTTLSERLAKPAITNQRRIIFPHVIRDPLHGDIRMTDFEWRILNSREFQRLRWIRQLGFAHLVYPGAEHSRLNHSLGAMYLTDKILRYIEDITGEPFDAEERLIARAYSLVHDVTHICYGHTLEDELGLYSRHDNNERRLDRLVLSDRSETGTVLRTTEYGREVLAYLDPASTARRYTHLRELIEAPSGPDVLDYIDRDSYFCGLDHRVDSAIFRHYRVIGDQTTGYPEHHIASRLYGRHGVRLDAEFALESVFLERFALFLKVYTHPTKIAAGAMVGKAITQLVSGAWKPEVDERTIEWMGDRTLLEHLARSRRQDCKRMAKLVMARELFKPAFRATPLGSDELRQDQYEARLGQFRERGLLDPRGRALAEIYLAKQAKIEPSEVILYCVDGAPGLQKLQQYVEQEPGLMKLRDEVHKPYLRTLQRHLGLWTVYVFTSCERGTTGFSRLGEAAERLLGLKNQISINRRQGILF